MSEEGDADTAYRQVLEDVDGDITITEQDGIYIGFNNRTIEGTLDVWDVDVLRIDGRDSAVEQGVVLWRGNAEKLDLGNSRSDHVIIRDSDVDTYWGARMETGYVNVKDSRAGSIMLSDTVLDELVLRDARIGMIDLSGAVLHRIDTDEDSVYDIVVDDDTYLHDVPDELVNELGYRRVTEQEQEVLYAIDQLGYRSEDPVDPETAAWYVQDVMDAADTGQQVHGIVSSLSRKSMVDAADGQYALTPRGMHAHKAAGREPF